MIPIRQVPTDNDEKKNEQLTSTYDPSQVFMSWLNDGMTQRPTTSSRKIRLTYSGTSLDGKGQIELFKM